MRRRELLRALLLVLGNAPVSAADERGLRSLTAGAETGTLSDTERETLLSFAEVLVSGRSLSSPERAEVLSHIDDRVRTTEAMLPLYRDAAALLDRLAGAPFSRLGILERSDLIARHHLAPARGRPNPPDAAAHSVRTRVAPDLIGGYYRSAAGWAVVGYGAFPGRCGDLVRYTRPES